jgi:hypothetical protein
MKAGYSAALRVMADHQILPHLEVFANLKAGMVVGMKTSFKQTGEDDYTRIQNIRDPNTSTTYLSQGGTYANQQGVAPLAEIGAGLKYRVGQNFNITGEMIYSNVRYKIVPENPSEGSPENRNTENLLFMLGLQGAF